MAALVLILWERLSRRFTWWVLCRSLPYISEAAHRHGLVARRRLVDWWMTVLMLLWPRPYRVFFKEVIWSYLGFEREFTPMPFDPEPALLEAKLYAEKRRHSRIRRSAVRAHRDGYFKQRIKCSNGCGTPYGQAAPGYSDSSPLNGWSCMEDKCSLREPHYCGRCEAEFRWSSADGSPGAGESVTSIPPVES